MKKLVRVTALFLAFALALSCAACGRENRAASMWLVKTEGTVSVSDGNGRSVAPADRLGLFSGYGVATEAASSGWIDLDDTKFTRMDENSSVEVKKDGKSLELVVLDGSVFFNVTKPLEDDETMTIRSANMVTAIRGTSGWVRVENAERMYVYILDGTVECSVRDESTGETVTESVSAWEYAELDGGDGEASITEGTFTAGDIPEFVQSELEEVPEGPSDAPDVEEASPESDEYVEMLAGVYYGDASACAMTPEQAGALAETLRGLISENAERHNADPAPRGDPAVYASLFDAGSGVPGMVFSCGDFLSDDGGEVILYTADNLARHAQGYYFFKEDGTGLTDEFIYSGTLVSYGEDIYVYDGYILVRAKGDSFMEPEMYVAHVNLLENGRPMPNLTDVLYLDADDGPRIRIDDNEEASPEELESWRAEWDPGSGLVCRQYDAYSFLSTGTHPAEELLEVLDAWASRD